MQSQLIPVLIFAQSARMLAQSAAQAGHPVWAADCFGDVDTLQVCERWLPLPDLSTLEQTNFVSIIEQLSQNQGCNLVFGSGLEYCYPLLDCLPDNVSYLGNNKSSIQLIRSPRSFYHLLNKLQLDYPKTQFTLPKNPSGWLVKQTSGMGGHHIQYLDNSTQLNPNEYVQQQIDGIALSALFLAATESNHILSIHQQFCHPTSESPFRLGHIETYRSEDTVVALTLQKIVDAIVKESGLIGLNSIDCILSPDGKLNILEINPRPSASMALVAADMPLIEYHKSACLGQEVHTKPRSHEAKSLAYFYADNDYHVPNNMIWPEQCSDLPQANSIIKQGQPICSHLLDVKNPETNSIHQVTKRKIIQQLISNT